jgi:2-haloacid dehalogenase
MPPRDEVLAFDVNETLLDLRALDAPFTAVFGDASLRPVWFQTMLQLSFVGGLTSQYIDFTQAQTAALQMLAQRAGKTMTPADYEAIVGGMGRLPAHAEVADALGRLRAAGYRQVTLTNSPLNVAREQLAFAGLSDLFDDCLSADEVRALKPAPAPYLQVASRTGVAIGQIRLIAAHAWDVSGALAAGARAAFVARGGVVPSPLGPQPDIVAPDIAGVADALLA